MTNWYIIMRLAVVILSTTLTQRITSSPVVDYAISGGSSSGSRSSRFGHASHINLANKYIVALTTDADVLQHTRQLHAALARENAREANDIEHKVLQSYHIPAASPHQAFTGYAGQFSPGFVEQLRHDPHVAAVVPDGIVHAFGLTQAQVDAPWSLSRISQRDIPEATATPEDDIGADGTDTAAHSVYTYPDTAGQGATVYVIDTGIKVDHPEFQGRAKWGATFCERCADVDDNGHGTHCAGSIAAKTFGVAKRATVVAVKVLDAYGSGTWSSVLSGINWVVAQVQASGDKRAVASMSLGGVFSDILNQAVQAAIQSGVTFVVAAGNEYSDACYVSPASAPGAITIGATDPFDQLAVFSNWGACVNLNAPGVNINSTWIDGTHMVLSGTSMATPHAAGVAALLLSQEQLSPQQVADKLVAIATPDKIAQCRGSPNLILHNGVDL